MDTEWERDRKLVHASWSAFAAAIRYTMNGGRGIPPKIVPYLDQVEKLALEFEQEPEQQGAVNASIWQDRAIELSDPQLGGVQGSSLRLLEMAIQLAGIVFEVAKNHGGDRPGGFGFGYRLMRESTRDADDPQLHVDMQGVRFVPRHMMEFMYLRAAELGVPVEELAAKKARDGF